MAYPYISAYSFTNLRGTVNPAAIKIEPFERSGVDGTGFINVGKRAEDSRLSSVAHYISQETVLAAKTGYYAAKGKIVQMRDENEDVWTVMITGVNVTRVKKLAISTTGGSWRIEAEWTVQVIA